MFGSMAPKLQRYDAHPIPDAGLSLTPFGMLRVRATVTKPGVFEYRQPDGSVRRGYRPRDEVFSNDSLESLALVPVTDGHPTDAEGKRIRVTSDNALKFARGAAGTDAEIVGDALEVTIMVSDSKLVESVRSGAKRGISSGYECWVDETPGVSPDGVRYDAVQRGHTNNHIALTASPRLGADMRLHVDGDGDGPVADLAEGAASMVREIRGDDLADNEGNDEMTIKNKTLTIDGLDFEVAETAAPAVEKAIAERDAKISKLEGDAVETGKTLAEAVERADAAEKLSSPDAIAAAAADRVLLVDGAKKIVGDEFDATGKTDGEVKLEVVAKAFPDMKTDGLDDVVVDSLFVAAVSTAKTETKGDETETKTKPARDPSLDAVRNATESRTDAEEKPKRPDEKKARADETDAFLSQYGRK